MPSVSVIIAAYNGAEFIAAAIESALAQTLPNVQVIVVDDGSTDTTPDVVSQFKSRVAIVGHENRGLSAARNAVLAQVESPYVAFLDHDDLWAPQFLERCVARLSTADRDVAGAVAGWVCIDAAGREFANSRHVNRGDIALPELVVGNRFAPGAVVLRREAIVEVGGFDEALRVTSDWDLWLRLAGGGWRFVTVAEYLWRYRLHAHNMSNNAISVRSDALRTLAKLFGNAALPADILRLRPRAIGNAHLHAAEHLYALGHAAEAAREFTDAVHACPELLEEDQTYYSLLCAEQPIGFKASRYHLDLDPAEHRILHALAACRDSGACGATSYRRSVGRAYRALLMLAYGQRRMHAARRYGARAVNADASLWRDRTMLMTALKSLAGARAVDALSRWRTRQTSQHTRAAPPRQRGAPDRP